MNPVTLLALALLACLTSCAALTDAKPDRTPWGGYARETGRVINNGVRP